MQREAVSGATLVLRPADLEFHTDGADVAFGAHVFHPGSCIFRTSIPGSLLLWTAFNGSACWVELN